MNVSPTTAEAARSEVLRPVEHGGRTSAVAGIGFSLAWVLGLSALSSSTDVRSSGVQILGAYTGHTTALTLQYLLTEGLAAICLAVVVRALAGRARTSARSRRLIEVSGLAAVAISLVQCGLGVYLSSTVIADADSGRAHDLVQAIDRLDGLKMFLLAGLALSVVHALGGGHLRLPNWLQSAALALAVTIVLSGIGYLLLWNDLAAAAWISLPLLLVFVTGTGITLSRTSPRG